MHNFSDNDMEKLLEEMKEDYYEKIDGRPLVYLFGGYRLDFIKRLQTKAEEKEANRASTKSTFATASLTSLPFLCKSPSKFVTDVISSTISVISTSHPTGRSEFLSGQQKDILPNRL